MTIARRRILARVALAGVATLWVALPLVWVLDSSIKPRRDQYRAAVIPWHDFEPTPAHWKEHLGHPQLARALGTSAVVASVSTLLCLILGAPAAYGLARFRFRRWKNENQLLFFLSQRILPPVVTVVPFYLMSRQLGLFDTLWILIAAHTTFNLPLVVLILRNGFADIPRELEEAAAVDGCSPLRIFLTIALPLSAPALSAATVIAFSFSWNEFLFALILTGRDVLTVPRFIQQAAENSWGLQLDAVAVLGLVAVLPPALLGLAAQRFIVRGLALGALK